MKRILPLLLLSLNAFGQPPTSGLHALTIHPGRNGDYDTLSFDIRLRPKKDTIPAKVDLKAQGWIVNDGLDTIRAELLVTFTSRRWGVAHARPGYVVMKTGDVVGYLSDRKRRLPAQVKVWGWKEIGGGR